MNYLRLTIIAPLTLMMGVSLAVSHVLAASIKYILEK